MTGQLGAQGTTEVRFIRFPCQRTCHCRLAVLDRHFSASSREALVLEQPLASCLPTRSCLDLPCPVEEDLVSQICKYIDWRESPSSSCATTSHAKRQLG